MESYQFQNPFNKPLEELQIQYKNSNSSYEECIPALDPRWCNRDYIFTLYVSPPSKNSNGEFTMGSKEDWMERMNLFIDDMNMILELDFFRFWSEVLYNNQFLIGVYSFLQNSPPFYLNDQVPDDKDILRMLKRVKELVFLVLIRLTSHKESQEKWMKKEVLGEILYNNFIITLPQLIEICLIYENDKFKDVTKIIHCVLRVQPNYISDVEKSTSFFSKVFSSIENQLLLSIEVNNGPSLIESHKELVTSVEVTKMILLILDSSYSLSTLLKVFPKAADIFHKNQIETRICSFYGNTIPVLNKYLSLHFNQESSQEKFKNYKIKLDLCRHLLISAVHESFSSCLSSILDQSDSLSERELKMYVDSYINTISECLSTDLFFIRDYNLAFPLQKDIKMLCDIYPNIDSLKCDYIIESLAALYDLPAKRPSYKFETQPSATTKSYSTNKKPTLESADKCTSKTPTGVELESLISEVKDILPHLGEGFVMKCLETFNYMSADVINAVLEGTLPESLVTMDPETPVIPAEKERNENDPPERVNIYDNDEFDVMAHDKVDTSKIHKGKRKEKHKDMLEMLDDKSHVNNLRDVYTKLSLVECFEDANEYEDEYDDTYDDVDAPVGNEGETEAEARRVFVTPRVLQQYKKREEFNYEEEADESEDRGAKADHFVENPALIRERQEQRRLDQRQNSSTKPKHDVVGKPKGQGQEKEVLKSREYKNTNKGFHGNHNRRSMADKKRRQGMLPT